MLTQITVALQRALVLGHDTGLIAVATDIVHRALRPRATVKNAVANVINAARANIQTTTRIWKIKLAPPLIAPPIEAIEIVTTTETTRRDVRAIIDPIDLTGIGAKAANLGLRANAPGHLPRALRQLHHPNPLLPLGNAVIEMRTTTPVRNGNAQDVTIILRKKIITLHPITRNIRIPTHLQRLQRCLQLRLPGQDPSGSINHMRKRNLQKSIRTNSSGKLVIKNVYKRSYSAEKPWKVKDLQSEKAVIKEVERWEEG